MVGIDTYITESDYITYATTRGIAINSDTLSSDLVLSADFINIYYDLADGYALPSDDSAKVAELSKAATSWAINARRIRADRQTGHKRKQVSIRRWQ
jgi:hypothetical protein